jgi:hypothetical protein
MSRFQSHLFNWLERSLPVALGRKTRKIFDQIARSLADKLAQIIADPEPDPIDGKPAPDPQRLPSAWRALLKPAYALMCYLAGSNQGTKPSTNAPVVEGIVVVPEVAPPDRGGALDRPRDYFQRLYELLEQAIAYFRQRQRALPDPALTKAAQGAQIPYEEPTVPWLDDTKLLQPEPNLTVIAENNLPETDAWAEPEPSHMRAWLESQVLLINYGDSWAVKLLLWLDRLVAKIEQWLHKLWQKIVAWWQSKFTQL